MADFQALPILAIPTRVRMAEVVQASPPTLRATVPRASVAPSVGTVRHAFTLDVHNHQTSHWQTKILC